MGRRRAPVPRMADLEALLLRDYDFHGRKSRQRAVAAFAHLRSHLDGIELARAFTVSLEYALARRSEGAAPATVRYEIAMLGRSLTLAVHHGWIPALPMLARPTVRNTRQGFVTAAELRAILRQLSQPVRDAAVFAYVTGWRRAEVFGLKWERVDLDSETVRLAPGQTKNDEGRVIPYGAHPWLRAVMARRLAATVGPYVFHRDGDPIRDFRSEWIMACKKAGVSNTVFHDLRRSAVRNMERAGVPRSVAMQIVGMRSESIYRRYAITNEEDLSRGIQLIAKLSMRGRCAEKESHDRI